MDKSKLVKTPKRRLPKRLSDFLAWVIVIMIVVILIWGLVQVANRFVVPYIIAPNTDVCRVTAGDPIPQTCIDKRFNECMTGENYSREECLTIATAR